MCSFQAPSMLEVFCIAYCVVTLTKSMNSELRKKFEVSSLTYFSSLFMHFIKNVKHSNLVKYVCTLTPVKTHHQTLVHFFPF
jgi:hypothetical protein